MTTREKAEQWLDRYKQGGAVVDIETTAEVFAEYLHEDGDSYREKYDKVREGFERLDAINAKLKARIAELEKQLEESECDLQASRNEGEYMSRQLVEAHGKIEAFKFCIRCNGMSGAEVRS